MSRRWKRRDFALSPEELGPKLIGARLVHVVRGVRRAGVIVETEAYCGADDDCSHAHNNLRTVRTEPMFGPPGLAYVYLSHGLHRCMNVVCNEDGTAGGVLIRALEPIEGLTSMRTARTPAGRRRGLRETDLCSGPGKLGEAMGIGLERSGEDMVTSERLWIEEGVAELGAVANTPRIGMNAKSMWGEELLRWVAAANPHASRGRGGVLNLTPSKRR